MSIKNFKNYFSVEFFYALSLTSGFIKFYIIHFDIFFFDISILLSFILLIFFFNKLVKKNFRIYLSQDVKIGFFLIIFFYLFILLSLIYSQSNYYKYEKLVSFSLSCLLYFFPLVYSGFNLNKFLDSFLKISILIISLYHLVNFLDYDRNYNTTYLKTAYLSGLNLLLYIFIYNKKNMLISFYFLFSLLITGSRGALVSFILISFIGFKKIYINFIINIFIKLKLIFFLLILFLVVFLYYDEIFLLFQRTIARSLILYEFDLNSPNFKTRFMHINIVFENLKDFIFFGVGFGGYGISFLDDDSRRYPHNIFLEILIELGIIGIIFYLLFVIYNFYILFKYKPNICYILLYLLIAAQFSGTFAEMRLFYGFLAIGLLASQRIKKINMIN